METRRGRKNHNSFRNGRASVNANCYEDRIRSGSSESSEGEIEFEGWVEFVTKKDGGDNGNGRTEKVLRRKASSGTVDTKKHSNRYGVYPEHPKNIEHGKYRRNNGHRRDVQYIDSNGRYFRQATAPMVHMQPSSQVLVNHVPSMQTQVQHVQHQTPQNNYVIQQDLPSIDHHHMIPMIPSHMKKDTGMIEPSSPIYVNPAHPSIIKNQQNLPQVYIRQPPTVIISNQPRPPLIINPPPANVILKNQAPQPIYVNHSRPNVIIKNEPPALNYPTNMDSVPIQLEHSPQIQMQSKGMQTQQETIYSQIPPQPQPPMHIQSNAKQVVSKIEHPTIIESNNNHNQNNTVSFIAPNGNGSAMQNEYMQYGNTYEIKTQTPPPNVIMMNPNENFQHIQNGNHMQPSMMTLNEIDRSFMVPSEGTQNEMFVNETYQFPQPSMQLQQPMQMESMPTPVMQMNPREYITQEIVMQPSPVEEYTTMSVPMCYEPSFNQTMQEVTMRNTQPILFQNSQPMIHQMVQPHQMIQHSQIMQSPQIVQHPHIVQQVGAPLRYTQTFTPTKVNVTPSRITHIQQNPPINQVQIRNPTPMNYVVANPNTQYVQTVNQAIPNRNVACTPLRRNCTMNVNANRINNNLAPKVQILAKPVTFRQPNNTGCR